MEVRDDSKVAELINSIGVSEQERAELNRETASRFPESAEAYMDLELEERLEMASQMVRTYYPIFTYEKLDIFADTHPKDKSVEVRVATDRPGIILNGFVAYDRGGSGDYRENPRFSRPRALYVWAQAEDATDDRIGPIAQLGRIELALSQGGRGRERRGNITFDLDDPRAAEMIEIIDAAAVDIINNQIHEARTQIGKRALQGAQE